MPFSLGLHFICREYYSSCILSNVLVLLWSRHWSRCWGWNSEQIRAGPCSDKVYILTWIDSDVASGSHVGSCIWLAKPKSCVHALKSKNTPGGRTCHAQTEQCWVNPASQRGGLLQTLTSMRIMIIRRKTHFKKNNTCYSIGRL